MKKVITVIIILALVISFWWLLEDEEFTANVATINITPPLSMKFALGGYGERMNKPAKAIHDKIWAKALALKKGSKKYVIITLDVLGLPPNVKVDLLKRISNSGWQKENLLLLPSHSHGSLEMEALNSNNKLNSPQIGIFHPELLEFLLDKLVVLIKRADRNYQRVEVGTSSTSLDGFNQNRRKEPIVDKQLIVTRIDRIDSKKSLAMLVNFTAHPTFIRASDMLMTGGWPAYLQKELIERTKGETTVMFYNGAEGDQAPLLNSTANNYEKIQIYGKNLAAKAFTIYSSIKTHKIEKFAFSYRTITLPEHKAHPDFMKTGGDEFGLDENKVKLVMKMLVPTSVGLAAIRIDDLVIAGVPGEMTAVLGLQLKHALEKGSVQHVAIGGLANEWISYILTRDQYTKGGGYESSVSFYGAGLGNLISKEIIKTALPLITE